jgi:DNA-binding transcriptional MerR regulator
MQPEEEGESMLKIREFAEIAQVSLSALRYYDEIGLFKPASVDPTTGYRLYSIDQLVRLNRILALKELGLDLNQIVQLLDEGVSAEALQGMLRLRKARLQQQIEEEQAQLAQIEARLKYIEQEGRKLAHEVVLKEVYPLTVLRSWTGVSGFQANSHYARNVHDLLQQLRIKITGPTHYIYHQSAENEDTFLVELAIPVDTSTANHLPAPSRERLSLRELPGVSTMASTVYRGSPHAILEAYQALGTWAEVNGYQIVGPCRKVCLSWEGELQEYLTEIQYPVEKEP